MLLGFTPYWDYKPSNAIQCDNPCVYTSEEIMNLSTKDTIRFKCVNIDGNVVNGSRQPILYMFVLDKLLGFKDFCEPETIH